MSKSKKQKNPRLPVLRPVRFKKKTTYDRKQSRIRKDNDND